MVGSLLAAFILAATGGLARMSGLGAAADSLSTWLGAFRATGGVSAFEIVQILFVYEIFALVVGAAGLVWVLLRSDRFGAWLGLSAILSIVIIVLQGGRQPIDLLLPVTLLALLAGYAIQLWAEAMTARATFTSDGVVFAVGAAVAGFLILQVTAFVRGRFVPTQLAGLVLQPEVTLLMLFVVLCLVVGVLLMLMYEPRTVLRGLVTLGLTALALVSLGAGWGVTQERAGDPREIILGSHVTPGVVRDLVAEAEDIAIRSDGSRFSLPVRVEVDDPVVAWYLRDARLLPDQAAAGAVTAFGQQPQGIDNAIGARFDTRLEWDPVGLDFDAWLEWVLFRTSPAYPPQVTRSVTLWARR